MKRSIYLCVLALALAGCVSTGPRADLQYLNLTPNKVIGVVQANDESLFGLSCKTQHIFEIDHHIDPVTGKDVCDKSEKVYSGTASAPGPVAQAVQSAAGASGAAGAAVAAPIMGALIPAANNSSTTNVKVSK